jgi:peptidyl-prolyl cis-trans isomerase A (cyclophilin A)
MFSSKLRILVVVLLTLVFLLPLTLFTKDKNPKVLIKTNMGDIELELYLDKAPITVNNFLTYVREGFYSNTIFHRVIDGFMIQCGGIDTNGNPKIPKDPIKNEAKNGLKNVRGTVAMARTQEIDSATSQFFINLVDNSFLDNGVRDYGYAVFGKVTNGMKVADKIAKVKTVENDFPQKPVVIVSITEIVEEAAKKE